MGNTKMTELAYLSLANKLLDEKDARIARLEKEIESLRSPIDVSSYEGVTKFFDTQAGYVIPVSELSGKTGEEEIL